MGSAPGYDSLLNEDDPIEAALLRIRDINRKKRADYAVDGSPFSNFELSSAALGLSGFGPIEAALFNITQKMARLSALRANGRLYSPANEAVGDTYLDLATYAVIALAMYEEFVQEYDEATSEDQGTIIPPSVRERGWT